MQRVAVVTGAGSGIGAAIAHHLAQAGHAVGVLDLSESSAAAVAADITTQGGQAIACQTDVADRASVDDAVARVRSQFGSIGTLVTAAAVADFMPFQQLSVDHWSRTIAINLTGTFHCVQAVIDDMVAARWGRIVTISSHAGVHGTARQVHYSASKGGVISLTKSIALEYASKGITANTIPPFAVDTPALRASESAGNVPPADMVAKMIPARRLGTPDDIAATCTFLCSDAAGYLTGQVIAVNGGANT